MGLKEWFTQWTEPDGFVLIRADGQEHNTIRGDLIPSDTLVIVEDGRHFVGTGENADNKGCGEFRIYREGHKTHNYVSQNS